jgi:hypothetical protein
LSLKSTLLKSIVISSLVGVKFNARDATLLVDLSTNFQPNLSLFVAVPPNVSFLSGGKFVLTSGV